MNVEQLIDQRLGEAVVKRVAVPKFRKSSQALDFIRRMKPDHTPSGDIVDPETGEVLMQPGETKRKRAKELSKRHRGLKDMVPFMFFPGDEGLFEDWYNVIWTPIEKIVSDPEMLRAGDYDVSYRIPRYIKRKDRKPFEDDDVDNIDEYIKYLNKSVLPHNIKLEWHRQGSAMAVSEPIFV